MSLPFYKRFPRDFFEGTVGMSFETKAAYGLVLDIIYMRDGSLPDDPRYIAGLLGCSVRKWNTIKKELIDAGKLHLENGIISNLRADDLVNERRKYRDKKAENRARPNKNKEIESRPRAPAETEPEPDTEDTSNEVSKPKSKKRGSQIGSWTPGPMDLAFARKKGLTPQEINHALEAFPAHHQSKGTVSKDWSASWRTWCLNTVKFRKPAQHAAGAQAGANAFDRLRQKLEIDTAGEQGGLWNEPGAVEGEFINITPNAHARSASGGY